MGKRPKNIAKPGGWNTKGSQTRRSGYIGQYHPKAKQQIHPRHIGKQPHPQNAGGTIKHA
jgi:hypothetical protein